MLLISEKVGGEFCRLPALIEIPRCYEYLFACVKRNKMGSGLLLKFIEYFPDFLSALSCMLSGFSWTTFVETAV